MRVYRWQLDNGVQGGSISGEVELEEGATLEDIEDAVREDMWNFCDLWWTNPEGAREP